jgi:hypothetical protein
MTKDEALKLALEALEPLTINAELRGDNFPKGNEVHKMADAGFKAITAIKAGLAQPPLPVQRQPLGWAKQSEIDYQQTHGGTFNVWLKKFDCDMPIYAEAAHAPLPVQEPTREEINAEAARDVNDTNAKLASHYFDLLKVVERYEAHGVTCQTFRHFVTEPCAECNCVAPLPWVGLTDVEIDECDWGQSERDHARAIEAKLKEKNT